MTEIDQILKERAKTHGSFKEHALISQGLKSFIYESSTHFNCVQAEALEMICHKIARILAGNPNHVDHWADIAGYAKLVVNDLEAELSNEQLSKAR